MSVTTIFTLLTSSMITGIRSEPVRRARARLCFGFFAQVSGLVCIRLATSLFPRHGKRKAKIAATICHLRSSFTLRSAAIFAPRSLCLGNRLTASLRLHQLNSWKHGWPLSKKLSVFRHSFIFDKENGACRNILQINMHVESDIKSMYIL